MYVWSIPIEAICFNTWTSYETRIVWFVWQSLKTRNPSENLTSMYTKWCFVTTPLQVRNDLLWSEVVISLVEVHLRIYAKCQYKIVFSVLIEYDQTIDIHTLLPSPLNIVRPVGPDTFSVTSTNHTNHETEKNHLKLPHTKVSGRSDH